MLSLLPTRKSKNNRKTNKLVKPHNILLRKRRNIATGILVLTSFCLPLFGEAQRDPARETALLHQLNTYRQLADLSPVQLNEDLADAAFKHARYVVINDSFGHFQERKKRSFYGETPSVRSAFSGYPAVQVHEVVQVGEVRDTNQKIIADFLDSVYHRLTVLSTEVSEVGIGLYNNPQGIQSAVLVFGSLRFRHICESGGTSTQDQSPNIGAIFTDICNKEGIYVDTEDWRTALRKTERVNGRAITWPPADSSDINIVAAKESPSPLPAVSVFGNPISVRFNESKLGIVKVLGFELTEIKDSTETPVETTFLTHKSDPAGLMAKSEFAIIPNRPLRYDTKYEIWIRYITANLVRELHWSFSTEKLPWESVEFTSQNQDISFQPDKDYAVLIPTTFSLEEGRSVIFIKDKIITLDKSNISPFVVLFKAQGEACTRFSISYLNFGTINGRLIPKDKDAPRFCLQRTIDALPGHKVYGLGETIPIQNNKKILLSLVPESELDTMGDLVWAAKESINVKVKQKGINTIEVRAKGKKNDLVRFRAGTKSFVLRIQ